MVNPAIFRAYDIRGAYGKDLDESDAKMIGKAFASFLKPKKVVVGRDNRLSSPSIAGSLISGLVESGVDVIDIGMSTSPMLYFAIMRSNADGGIEVTGSHLEKHYNGFKLCRKGAAALFGEEIQEIRKIIEKKKFTEPKEKGKIERKEIEDDYVNEIKTRMKISRKLRAVVDTGNGAAGPVFEKVLNAIGVKADFIFKEPDGNFPNHEPDPAVESHLESLKKKVVGGKYDIGIATDGDADRAFFIDEKGNTIKTDQAIALLAGEILKKKRRAKIFTEVRGSMMIRDYVSSLGGKFVMGKIGHSLIKAEMRKDGGIEMAGEASGHLFFREFSCLDDGIFASCKMIQLLSSSGKRLSHLAEGLPKYFSTQEYRPEVDDKEKFGIVEKIKKEFEKMAKERKSGIVKINGIDGIRVEFEDGWGLVRAANTSPVLSMRFEARTEKRMKEIEKMFMEKAEKYIKK